MSVSVILPTKSSGKTLARTLASLLNQGLKPLEVVVVDSYSGDETLSIARKYGARVILHKGGRASARNKAILEAKGRYVLLLDADQAVDGDLLNECVNLCEVQGVDAVKIVERFIGDGFWSACSAYWREHVQRVEGVGGNIPRFYRRSILLKAGLFNDSLSLWEDYELYLRVKSLGAKEAWCGSNVKILHVEPSLAGMIVRSYRYGESAPSSIARLGGYVLKDKVRVTLRALRSALSGTTPLLALGVVLTLTLKGIAYLVGLLASALRGRSSF
ncbi:MAG: glycosyltransferase [Candidatus Nezhaarchaeales archaeon]